MTRKADDNNAPNGDSVKIRVTRLGAGKVSTGVHAAAEGETMADAGALLTVPQRVAEELEARGLAEISVSKSSP